jgi:hypothetical protein
MADASSDGTIAGLADRTTGLVGWTIAWRATSAVATLALGAFLIRQLPAAEYGRYTFVLSVLVYIALLATFGQDQGLLRYLPEILGRGDRAAAHDLLRKSAIAIFAVWVLTSVAVFALRPVIDSLLQAHVADLLALGTVLLLGGIAAGVLSFALVAIYDMRSQAVATPLAGALTLALAVIFLRRGTGLNGVLVAGAIGQSALAVVYLLILLRRIRRAGGTAGDRVGWRRLLVYASGWLPSLLIASAVGLQFENIFLLRFAGSTAVAYYDTGYNIPQRLVSLIPSLLTGAWVVGTLEGWRRESDRIRTSVTAFYKGTAGPGDSALHERALPTVGKDRSGDAAVFRCCLAGDTVGPGGPRARAGLVERVDHHRPARLRRPCRPLADSKLRPVWRGRRRGADNGPHPGVVVRSLARIRSSDARHPVGLRGTIDAGRVAIFAALAAGLHAPADTNTCSGDYSGDGGDDTRLGLFHSPAGATVGT